MSSEYQELLEKLLNSDTTDVIPQSRAEYIMLTAINSLDIDTLPEPGSRMEAYLMALITKMGEGGSASQIETDPTVPAWAKEPTKPTYTAYEIQAQPDMYVLDFDKLIDNLTAKTVVYISQASLKSPIPYDRYPVLVMRSVIDRGSASITAYDSTGKTWSGSVNFSTGTIDLKERTLAASDIGAISAPATAEVGQTIVVKSVDGNGHPTEWEAVSIPTVDDILAALPGKGVAINGIG